MTSTTGAQSDHQDPATYPEPAPSEDSMVEVEPPEDDKQDDHAKTEEPKPRKEQKKTKPGKPAYVAPIPKIGPISPITPVSPPSLSAATAIPAAALPTSRLVLPNFVASYLVGKTVDESGDIIDEKTGQVIARAGGDLPSIVGRKVSNIQGDILGDDGELLGWIEDLNIEKTPIPGTGSSPKFPPMKTLAEMMGRANASLMVDPSGNILDANGNVVGKLHDNNNPEHRKEREEQERARLTQQAPAVESAATESARAAREEKKPEPASASSQPESEEGEGDGEESSEKPNYQRRTEDERRQNAQAWRKEAPGESPSDIFLDVKSTTEGIQLTIRIPTVFGNGQQVRPNISFS